MDQPYLKDHPSLIRTRLSHLVVWRTSALDGSPGDNKSQIFPNDGGWNI